MNYQVTIGQLINFVQSFLPPEDGGVIFNEICEQRGLVIDLDAPAGDEERKIAEEIIRDSVGIVEKGSVSSLVTAFIEQGSLDIKDVLQIVEGARVFFEFMQELVQSSIEHISQGISVVDKQMRMVAWNRRYLEFFEYPEDYVRIGRPVADLIRFNLERIGCEPENLDTEVAKRVGYLQQGQPHNFERYRPEGRVLEVSGNPMPGGGFVTSYTDITSHKELERELREANETLEQRVQERTRELEEANFSKNQFLAATSHDLMQPLNAAGLFVSALDEKVVDAEDKEFVSNISSSLEAATDLLNSLLEVSRIDSGAIRPKYSSFYIDELLSTLDLEFTALAEDKGLSFCKVKSSQVVYSDKQLLRRILQNLLSNAIRYTDVGRIIVGCRVRRGVCRVEIWDTGIGVPEDKREEIFQEFRRLEQQKLESEQGLGLGLAIADRLGKLLGHRLGLRSWQGKGSVFSVEVPLSDRSRVVNVSDQNNVSAAGNLTNRKILCIDNDSSVLEAMKALLDGWGCEVLLAADLESAKREIKHKGRMEAILADYQLDDGVTGVDVLKALNRDRECPSIVITANNTEEVRQDVEENGYHYLAKPLKPGSLRALLSGLLG